MKTADHVSSTGVHSVVRRVLVITALAATCFVAPVVRASGIHHQAVTGSMYRQLFQTVPGASYTFTTRNLSASSDTIIHVLSYPGGQFIAGNDDTVTTDPDSGQQVVQPFSTVSITGTGLPVYLIVRGKPGTPDGTADFRIFGTFLFAVVKDSTTHIDFSAGFVQTVGSLAAGTHITTVEENLGALDTIVMVFGNNDPVSALAYDDDDGVDFMSFARLGTACTANCQIVVGSPKPGIHIGLLNLVFPPGPVTLVWDESIEASGHDPDHDGLSTELEATLTTNAGNSDTDGDGINDGFEVYGAVLTGSGRNAPVIPGGGKGGNLLKFPKYGANPVLPDVFVEVDWVPACPASDPNCCTGTSCPAGALVADQRRAAASEFLQAFNSMRVAVRPHFDIGIPTAAGDSNVIFGDWGGANRLSEDQVDFARPAGATNYTVTLPKQLAGIGDQDCFAGAVPARVFSGSFHHLVVSDDATAGRLPILGTTLFESAACALVRTGDGSIAHELGHNFNLRHGGFASAADGEINCKMNYGSIMSYPNQLSVSPFAPGYSTGRFGNLPVNGFAMNEATGLGVTDTGILNVFNTGAMGRGAQDVFHFPSGIDWNMDGQIQTGSVRAPANWATTTCASPYLRGNWSLMIRANSDANTFSTAALPVMTVAEASAASPQIFGAGRTSGTISPARNLFMIGFGDSSRCQQQGLGTCTIWSQRIGVDFSSNIIGFNPQSQLAVAGPIVAFRDPAGNLRYMQRGKSLSSYGAAGFLGSGIVGDPAAIEVNGRVKIYAVDSSGFLRRWEMDEANNTWPVHGEADFWEDGNFVQTDLGIGIAHGVVRPTGPGVYAAIPNRAKASAGNPMPIEFARQTSTTFTRTITVPAHSVPNLNFTVPAYTYRETVHQDRWSRFAAPGASAAFSKPGLVYAPFDLAAPDDGRFYMTWVPGGNGFQSTTAFIMFTEGNNQTAGSNFRRLRWMNNQLTPFADPEAQSRDFRSGVGLARFGASVVGVASDRAGSNYFPAADGIVNVDFHDFEDNLLVRHNLPCSVHGQSCDDSL